MSPKAKSPSSANYAGVDRLEGGMFPGSKDGGIIMNVIEWAERLIDIPSVTGQESALEVFLNDVLRRSGFRVVRQEFEPGRANLFATAGDPIDVVFCTHMDTVPPFFGSSRKGEFLDGRGACDAKGSMAAMLAAGLALRDEGFVRFGFLFVAGEETDSRGAKAAAALRPKSRFIMIGEPTGNRLAAGHQGVLNFRLVVRGRSAHSAFPHLGDSAIHRLLDVLDSIRAVDLGEDPILGKSSLNIGLIEGGTAANVLAPSGQASLLVRCAIRAEVILDRLMGAIAGRASVEVLSKTDPQKLGTRPGFQTTVLPFGSDAPYLGVFGERFLLGPGAPEDAHTEHERVGIKDLEEAVLIYRKLARSLAEEPAAEMRR
jgi:acetylornithine deacetylase